MKPISNTPKDIVAREEVQEASNPEFTEASSRENIGSGEPLSTLFGKIKKFFTDLKTVAFSGSYNDLSNTPNLSTVATSGSYNDLSNKPTIPTVNNATLTIQKNGTNVQTFTANASSNVTCNIEVPTNTNQLTNGANFITASANITGTSKNVTGTVAIANGGTGATTRLGALQNLTNENVGTSAGYFLTITDSWKKGGYTSVANAKTVLGLKDLAYIAKGSDTTKYLRNDGSWVKPPNDNTTYSAGTGISLSGTTFSNSGVRAISTGSSNGTISVNTNGTSANVAVKGLGSAAYVNADTAASKSTIAQRDSNGYLKCVYLNTSNAAENINSYSGALVGFASTDGWLRKTSKENFQSYLGLGSAAYLNASTYGSSNVVSRDSAGSFQVTNVIAQGSSNWVGILAAATACKNYANTAYAPVYASSYPGTSSRRFKENIVAMTDEEAKKILQVESVTFDYRAGMGIRTEEERYNQRGVIAEDVEQIIPYVVDYEEVENEGKIPYGVDYSKFTPYLIKMCQIQQEEINSLKDEVSELKKLIQNS